MLAACCATQPSAARIAPQAVLYLHLHEATLLGADGVARVEGLGPHTLSQLQVLLARTNVVVKPVIDLADRVRTTAYEHPEAVKERVHLITGGDYWPYAVATGREVDYDHPTPYRPGAPPRGSHRRPAPTTPARSADDTTAGRPTPATARVSAATAATSGSPPTAWRSSSTTAAPDRIDPAHARLMLTVSERLEHHFPDQADQIELALNR